jgi:hypothetical protein
MIVAQISWGASPTLLLGTANALVIGNVRRAQCFLLRVCKFFTDKPRVYACSVMWLTQHMSGNVVAAPPPTSRPDAIPPPPSLRGPPYLVAAKWLSQLPADQGHNTTLSVHGVACSTQMDIKTLSSVCYSSSSALGLSAPKIAHTGCTSAHNEQAFSGRTNSLVAPRSGIPMLPSMTSSPPARSWRRLGRPTCC